MENLQVGLNLCVLILALDNFLQLKKQLKVNKCWYESAGVYGLSQVWATSQANSLILLKKT